MAILIIMENGKSIPVVICNVARPPFPISIYPYTLYPEDFVNEIFKTDPSYP